MNIRNRNMLGADSVTKLLVLFLTLYLSFFRFVYQPTIQPTITSLLMISLLFVCVCSFSLFSLLLFLIKHLSFFLSTRRDGSRLQFAFLLCS